MLTKPKSYDKASPVVVASCQGNYPIRTKFTRVSSNLVIARHELGDGSAVVLVSLAVLGFQHGLFLLRFAVQYQTEIDQKHKKKGKKHENRFHVRPEAVQEMCQTSYAPSKMVTSDGLIIGMFMNPGSDTALLHTHIIDRKHVKTRAVHNIGEKGEGGSVCHVYRILVLQSAWRHIDLKYSSLPAAVCTLTRGTQKIHGVPQRLNQKPHEMHATRGHNAIACKITR